MQQTIEKLRSEIPHEAWDRIWSLPEKISITDWAEKKIYLPEKVSAHPGYIRFSLTPYLVGPLQALANVFIEEVVLVWGRQLAKSTMIYIFLCWLIAQDPGPTTFLWPTKDKAKEIQETKLDPIFKGCAEIIDKMPQNPDDYTKLRMSFQTMVLAMAWGGSESQGTTRSNRYLLIDEMDEIKREIGQNAIDPVSTIEQTTTTFFNRKKIKTSTPTDPEGRIWKALKNCHLIFELWISCVHCEKDQILYWENVKFGEDHDPEVVKNAAFYECEHCHAKISNLDKVRNLGNNWRARLTPDPCDQIMKGIRVKIEDTVSLIEVLSNPDYQWVERIGFHLPKWYGTFDGDSFGVIAEQFLKANKALRDGEDFAPMRQWRMHNAAKPWEEEAQSKTEIELLENRINLEPKTCPRGTIALTCGIDPSEGLFYFDVIAWYLAAGIISSHLVEYGKLFGWDSLGNFIQNVVYPVSGEINKKGILISGLDTGGSEYDGENTTMTEAAYQWILKMRQAGFNVFGTKGMSHPSKDRAKQSKVEKMPGRSGKPIPGGLVLWEINTDEMKRVLWFHLKIEKDKPGRFTFHGDTGNDYVKHILAEKEVLDKNGNWQWVRKGRNHHLDATVIAMTLAERDCYGLQIFSGVRTKTERRVISKGVE